VIHAVRAQGRRLILSRGWAGLAAEQGDENCLVVSEVNQQQLFRRVAAVVHHGGAGTTTTAARAGVPQVIVPQLADQPYWASRVAALGIGVAHDGPAPTPETLGRALETALTPEVLAQAQAVGDRISDDGTTIAARLLLEGRRTYS